jgi:outer membrane protein
MNERGRWRGARLALCALGAFSVASASRRVRAEPSAPVLASPDAAGAVTEALVIERALAQSPTLAAARTELQRARLLEQGERRRYGLVLQLDTEADRNAVPSLGVNGVTVGESTVYRVGAELRRHFDWGTDVSLRLEGSSQLTQSAFFNPTTNPPDLNLIELGPGWGALLQLSLTQPLLRGAGRDVFEAELRAASAARASAASAAEQAASQLLLDVRTAYWELYYATSALEIQRRSLALAEAQLAQAAARVRTGSLAPVDELSFQTNVATLEEAVASAVAEADRRANELGRLVGEGTLRARRADVTEPPPAPPPMASDLLERALEASYQLAEQRAQVELAEVRARTAADPLRHRLDVDAYVQTQGLGNKSLSPALEQFAGLGAWSAHVGVTYEAPLDDTRRRTENARAELAVTVARQNLEAVRLRVVADLESAASNSEASRRRLDLARQTRSIAERQLAAETERFRSGGATALEVRVAEDQVRSAQLREVRAGVDLISAHLLAAHLTGRLLTDTGAVLP